MNNLFGIPLNGVNNDDNLNGGLLNLFGNGFNGGGGFGNNSVLNMLNSAFGSQVRYSRTGHAKSLDAQWKQRAKSWGDDATKSIDRKRKRLETLFSEPGPSETCLEEEVVDNSELVTRLITECDALQNQIAEMDKLVVQKEPLSVEQVKAISDLEVRTYESVMAGAREKILAEQRRREEIYQLTTTMFEQIEDKWESGIPDADIRQYIKEMVSKMYPATTEENLDRFTDEVFRIGTQHLDVRIWLTQEQIDRIPLKQVSELQGLAENPQCHNCLEPFAAEDQVRTLPCDQKHIFHPQCIDPWLKRKTTCPMCKKDLREWVVPNYTTCTGDAGNTQFVDNESRQSMDISDNEDNDDTPPGLEDDGNDGNGQAQDPAAPNVEASRAQTEEEAQQAREALQLRQLELLEQFLTAFFPQFQNM